jgi:hypothetical protein
MATKTTKRAVTAPRYPERKWGPFHGGVGVAVWLNEVQTADGKRWFRSITIAPRRYIDDKTGKWEDASSLRTTDLPSLILALHKAQTEDPS